MAGLTDGLLGWEAQRWLPCIKPQTQPFVSGVLEFPGSSDRSTNEPLASSFLEKINPQRFALMLP